jgi:hypothetical protein
VTVGVEAVGQRVVARYAQGDERGRGTVFSYTDVPTVGIQYADGTRDHWRADMCEIEVEADD